MHNYNIEKPDIFMRIFIAALVILFIVLGVKTWI